MSKDKNWVDYNEIKSQVSLEQVLRHYGAFDKLKKGPKNYTSACPIHKGSNSRQFSVDLEGNRWHCFGNCKEGGNAIDLIAMMEFGEKTGESFRKAALLAKNWFLSGSDEPDTSSNKPAGTRKGSAQEKSNKLVKKENKPLTFELQNLNPNHEWFAERGIEPRTVEHFGLGFCSRGMMKGRIAIPIRNERGELVAYCGRAINDDFPEDEGKYKLPGDFLKSLVVYNLHNIEPGLKTLILVESYISVWWLWQAGIENVLALQGSKLCKEQKKLILGYFEGRSGGIYLMFDDDEDGLKCTKQCLDELSKDVFLKWVDIGPYRKKPHRIKPEDLKKLF